MATTEHASLPLSGPKSSLGAATAGVASLRASVGSGGGAPLMPVAHSGGGSGGTGAALLSHGAAVVSAASGAPSYVTGQLADDYVNDFVLEHLGGAGGVGGGGGGGAGGGGGGAGSSASGDEMITDVVKMERIGNGGMSGESPQILFCLLD